MSLYTSIPCLLPAFALLSLATPNDLGESGKAKPQADTEQESKVGFSDSDVTMAVEREFFLDSATPSALISTATSEGIVTLTGDVPSLLAKERSARIAETVKGVRAVVNRIQVRPAEALTDDQVISRVRQALVDDPATDSYEVTVQCRDGHVILSGSVDSWTEKELCGKVAKAVAGVKDFTSEVKVRHQAERIDGEIQQEIEKALEWNALVDHGLIHVTVDQGNVRLTGTVGSAAEKRQASLDAWTAGVSSVDDSGLRVARWARDEDLRKKKYLHRSDAEIEQAIEDALAQDPRVNSFDVVTSVYYGTPTLTGAVDNFKAKRAAEQDARNTVGVGWVRNYLKVRPSIVRSDETIVADVQEAFARDPYLDVHDVTVEVDSGTVRLYGAVDSLFEKGQADDLVARVQGVTDIVNDLRVRDTRYAYDPFVDDWNVYDYDWYRAYPLRTFSLKSDRELRKDIEDELFWSPFVDSDDIEVLVDDGVATLKGEVDSWMERGSAQDNAYEAGASHVRNRLVVNSVSTLEAGTGG